MDLVWLSRLSAEESHKHSKQLNSLCRRLQSKLSNHWDLSQCKSDTTNHMGGNYSRCLLEDRNLEDTDWNKLSYHSQTKNTMVDYLYSHH